MRKIDSLKTSILASLRRRRTAQQRRRLSLVERLEFREMLSAVPSALQQVGDVFYIDMENHNLTQPANVTSPPQIKDNPAAPYINSLIGGKTTDPNNSQQVSYATDYENVVSNNDALHPSEPNYLWQESGQSQSVNANDGDPYDNVTHTSGTNTNNINSAANLSGLLQNAGISWESYQEDIDLTPSSGSVNQPGGNALTSTVAPQNQWTVPLQSFGGTSSNYKNPYNGSDIYGYTSRHDGQLYFTDTNGSTSSTPNFSTSNPEVSHYSPLQQLQADLNSNSVGRYNLITPDLYNDMHTALPPSANFTYAGVTYNAANPNSGTDEEAIAEGDNFLSILIPEIMASQAYKNNGVIVIWFDEAEPEESGPQFPMTEIVISPLAKGNAYDSTLTYTHSSDLKTMQEVFNVQAPGGGFLGDANTAGTNDLSDLFKSAVSGTGSTVAATVGGTFSGALATFTDADGDVNPGDFTATIDWGDGTSASPDTSVGIVGGGAGGLSVSGSHTYANEGTYAVTVTINDMMDGDTATINAEVLANPHAVYVAAVYQDVLGRAPDGGGLVFWTHSLDTGSPISSVAAEIGHSAEYYQNFVIKPAYLQLLGRAADASGLQFWTTQMLGGVTDQKLEAGFISAAEFYNNAGGTDLDWVDSVYTLLLGRTADQSGETYWTGQLSTLESTESAEAARSQVAVRISTSQENNTNLINADYQKYLGRAADPQGLQFWLSQFAAGQTNEDVIAGFTGSAEYYKDKTGVNP